MDSVVMVEKKRANAMTRCPRHATKTQSVCSFLCEIQHGYMKGIGLVLYDTTATQDDGSNVGNNDKNYN